MIDITEVSNLFSLGLSDTGNIVLALFLMIDSTAGSTFYCTSTKIKTFKTASIVSCYAYFYLRLRCHINSECMRTQLNVENLENVFSNV